MSSMVDNCLSTSAVSCWVAGVVKVRVLLAVALDTWGVVTVVVAGALTELLCLTGLGVLEGLFLNFPAAIRVADSFLFRSTVRFFLWWAWWVVRGNIKL